MSHFFTIFYSFNKREKRKNTRLFFAFMLHSMLFGLMSCYKPIPIENIESGTFLRVLESEKNQTCFNIEPTADDGFLIISAGDLVQNDNCALTILKLNSFGKIEWKNTLPDTVYDPQVTTLKDGTFLITSRRYFDKMIKLSNDGTLIFKTGFYNFYQPSHYYSNPIEGENGKYFFAQTNGGATGSASINIIRWFNSYGDYISGQQIQDTTFGGKISQLKMYAFENPKKFFLYGLIYTYPFDWSHNPNIFVSRIEYNGFYISAKKTTILDPGNTSNRNYPWYNNYQFLRSVYTKEKELVISSLQTTLSGTNQGFLVKVNQNLDKVWELNLNIGKWGTVPKSIKQSNDGNFLVAGSCWVDGNNQEQPFVCKIGRDGNLLWSKIIPLNNISSFNSCFHQPGGSLIFGGTTNGFGNGITGYDLFLLKTDENGNMK